MPYQAPPTDELPKQDRAVRMLRDRIVRGRMAPGTRMPSHLRLARELEVSSVTAQLAVQRLAQEGFIETRARSGTFVAQRLPHLTNYALVFWNDPNEPFLWSRYYQTLLSETQRLSTLGQFELATYFSVQPNTSTDKYRELLDLVNRHAVGGLIFANAPYALARTPLLTDVDTPRVALTEGQFPNTLSVAFDYRAWIELALERMAQRGRKRIAIISGGYFLDIDAHTQSLIQQFGLTSPPHWRLAVPPLGLQHHPQYSRGMINLTRLLMQGSPQQRPDGLIVSDDNFIEHVVSGLLAQGLRVPEDLDVISLANLPNLPSLPLPVTFLANDITAALETSLKLMSQLREPQPCPQLTLLPPRFV